MVTSPIQPSGVRVLLIDPDATQRTLIERALRSRRPLGAERYDFEIEQETTLAGGLARLGRGDVDAVFLELAQPDSRGTETLERVRESFPDIPVIVLTALEDEQLGLRAVAAGAQDYLIKSHIHPHVVLRVLLYARERHRQQSELYQLALVDPLTGLYNRRGFLTFADQLVRLARRTSRALVLLFVDLDDLKVVNDTHGHDHGDRVLQETSALLRSTFRATDVVGRIGGDEFAVLAIDAPPDTVSHLTRRLRLRIDQRNAGADAAAPLSISIGSASLAVGDRTSLDELLQMADRAMYGQKRSKSGDAE
jgi:diguanylate cyclase (GGDEF)-like protein